MKVVCGFSVTEEHNLHCEETSLESEKLPVRERKDGWGGSPNAARLLANLGWHAHVAGIIGRDGKDIFIRKDLEQAGISSRLYPLRARTPLAISVNGSINKVITQRDPIECDSDATYALAEQGTWIQEIRPDCVFAVSVKPDDAPFVLNAFEVAPNAFRVFNPGEKMFADHACIEAFKKIASMSDLLTVNHEEAAKALGVPISEMRPAFIDRLLHYCEKIVVTWNHSGAYYCDFSCRQWVPAVAVSVVDSCGAGDAFNSGFLYSYLKDRDPREALRFGAITAGLKITKSGGYSVPTREEILGQASV